MKVPARKRIVACLGMILVLVLGAGIYLLLQLTAALEPEWVQEPNKVDAFDAKRKLRLLTISAGGATNGFVRLSEVEINSYLQEHIETKERGKDSAGATLRRAALFLSTNEFTFICWLDVSIFGRLWPVVLQRHYHPSTPNAFRSPALKRVQIGRLSVPESIWKKLEDRFRPMDNALEERHDWIAQWASVRLEAHEETKLPEVRIYNYLSAR